ncbi:nineteen complex-related protein 2-domain-containing protein [Durotheca rogersii]|uniref:nineteen complex-related protein 2-domain-containing protein n=1 Tax=Durotheca rogersii TaxID=419775 RepID=UPI00221FCCBF|nr:nineteen complex-related protein 2-domain-containing protein [Durotheca rogersii]KAI5865748.1 nineteen complex-related protein 2-domain-containing protein [Durotheca rogersii]
MSAFGAKRKARKIAVRDDDDDIIPAESLNPPQESQGPALQPSFKTSRKPFKQSSLRKGVSSNDDTPLSDQAGTKKAVEEAEDDEDGGVSLRTRPLPAAKAASTKGKKPASTSRLSFGGPGEDEPAGDEDSMILGEGNFTSSRRNNALAHAAAENNAYKKGFSKNNLPLSRLPMRSTDSDEDRPRYSREYLSELQLSTPNVPQDLSKLHPTSDEDEMVLDPSELEGALVVDTPTSLSVGPPAPANATAILTEAEIQEKKSRRARLAREGGGGKEADDFISLSDDEDQRGRGDSYLTVLSRSNNKLPRSETTRLVAEDEDLGEGFEEFVEDGGLSLGRKAEREARRRRRAEMASLITAAEGDDSGGDASDDSEAERRAAYEAAQTRAGMDGLAAEREEQRRRLLKSSGGALAPPPKITPLPDLSVLVDAFKERMRAKEEQMARLRARIAELQAEREGVLKREPEVQRLLNEAGERYRALMIGGTGAAAASPTAEGDASGDADGEPRRTAHADNFAAAKSLLEQVRAGGGDTPGQRGLESLGTTPVRQPGGLET